MKTWIFSIARNEYFRWLRRNPPSLPLDESIPAPTDLAGDYREREKIREAFGYLNGLEEPLRSLMCLRIFGGLSFREIAALQMCIRDRNCPADRNAGWPSPECWPWSRRC